MTQEKITAAVREAERFIERALDAKQRLKHETAQQWSCHATKQTAAMKRASLDLTRALADLRKP